jgi:hypothetical protein
VVVDAISVSPIGNSEIFVNAVLITSFGATPPHILPLTVKESVQIKERLVK